MRRPWDWPAFWRGYRRGVLQGYLVGATLLLVALLVGCAPGQRWDRPDALTAAQRIEYAAGEGLLTLIHAVNVATARVDTLRRTGAITADDYQRFVQLRLDFRPWFQTVYQTYVEGGNIVGEEAAFYDWQAKFVDLYLGLTAKKGGGA